MGPIGSKVIEVKGQIFVVVFFCFFLPGPWADLHQTWREGGGRPRILASFFERSRSNVKFMSFFCLFPYSQVLRPIFTKLGGKVEGGPGF